MRWLLTRCVLLLAREATESKSMGVGDLLVFKWVVFVGMAPYELLFADTSGHCFKIDVGGAIEPITAARYYREIDVFHVQIEYVSRFLCILSPHNHLGYSEKGYTQRESIAEPRDEAACRSLLARLQSEECVLDLENKRASTGIVIVYARLPPTKIDAANPVLDVLSRLCRLI